jgi:prepilin-type N-terminal cleavage/methylation domain-containing protein
MGERGYSLIEMMVTVCIVSVLTVIATLKFNDYLDRSRKESQTRMLYEELLKSRAAAVYERRGTRIKVYPDHFENFSSICKDETVAPVERHELRFPVVCNTADPIDFLQNGLAKEESSICLDGDNGAPVDSVIISYARIRIGKKEPGKDCNAPNITVR